MKRFSITNNGYDIDEVNRFVDVVIRKLEVLNNDNAMYRKKVLELEQKLESNSNVDDK